MSGGQLTAQLLRRLRRVRRGHSFGPQSARLFGVMPRHPEPRAMTPDQQKLLPKDWTLLVIAEQRGKQVEPVVLQKTLFLLGERVSLTGLNASSFYNFVPYDYGPFCKDVYSDASALEDEGFILIRRPPATSFNTFAATKAGLNRAEELRKRAPAKAVGYLERVVEWATALSFNQLVSAIYREFPAMKENSVFNR